MKHNDNSHIVAPRWREAWRRERIQRRGQQVDESSRNLDDGDGETSKDIIGDSRRTITPDPKNFAKLVGRP
jgi:hypothetical protein